MKIKLIVFTLLFACSSVGHAQTINLFMESMPDGHIGSGYTSVFLNGENVGFLKLGLSLSLQVNKGEHTISFKGAEITPLEFGVSVSEGHQYMLIQDGKIEHTSFDVFETARATPHPERQTVTEKILIALSTPIMLPLSVVSWLIFGS